MTFLSGSRIPRWKIKTPRLRIRNRGVQSYRHRVELRISDDDGHLGHVRGRERVPLLWRHA